MKSWDGKYVRIKEIIEIDKVRFVKRNYA